jgi:hypothetical protein
MAETERSSRVNAIAVIVAVVAGLGLLVGWLLFPNW